MKKLRIGYFADGPWSHEALVKLLMDETLEIAFICARNDKPDEILRLASREQKIDFFSHPRINSIEFFDLVSSYKCDLFVSMSFNQIFKNALINLPPLRTINCHAGKLPFYRENIMDLIELISKLETTDHFQDEEFLKASLPLQNFLK